MLIDGSLSLSEFYKDITGKSLNSLNLEGVINTEGGNMSHEVDKICTVTMSKYKELAGITNSLELIESEPFNKLWEVMKDWDINVPDAYEGYCSTNGTHIRCILDALGLIDKSPTTSLFSPRIREVMDKIEKKYSINIDEHGINWVTVDTVLDDVVQVEIVWDNGVREYYVLRDS